MYLFKFIPFIILAFVQINSYPVWANSNIEALIGYVDEYDRLPHSQRQRVLGEVVDHLDGIQNRGKIHDIAQFLRRMVFLERLGFDSYEMKKILDADFWSKDVPPSKHVFNEVDAQISKARPASLSSIQRAYTNHRIFYALGDNSIYDAERVILNKWHTLTNTEKRTFAKSIRTWFLESGLYSHANDGDLIAIRVQMIDESPVIRGTVTRAGIRRGGLWSAVRRHPYRTFTLVAAVSYLAFNHETIIEKVQQYFNGEGISQGDISDQELFDGFVAVLREKLSSTESSLEQQESRPRF